eukprot:2180039-Pyramimonas_sp.AAC.1
MHAKRASAVDLSTANSRVLRWPINSPTSVLIIANSALDDADCGADLANDLEKFLASSFKSTPSYVP